MCGIVVVLTLREEDRTTSKSLGKGTLDGNEQRRAKLAKELDDSLELIKHRGPDWRGQWISSDSRVALGHVRLAINDLTADGAQPFHDDEDTVHAVVNGELYDHEHLRAELVQNTGYIFKSRSDCEIVIALYKYYGLSFLSKLRGEFSVCLYDSSTHVFIAARDRYGIKPLYWTVIDGRLLIAAEAKAFLPLGWKPEWDVQSIMDSGWVNGEKTLFRDISKVRAGHYVFCKSFGHIEQRQFWDIDYPDKYVCEKQTEGEMIEGVRCRMLDAVRVRLRADVPVGIYLSGGLDSSVIAGMVTHLVKDQGERVGSDLGTNRVNCFSIAFDEESGFDESSIATRTAQHLGVKIHIKRMSETEIATKFEDATWHCEHHNPNLNFVGRYAISETATKAGFKVVLTGDGSDEHFGGYPTFVPDFLREPDLTFPQGALPEQFRREKLEESNKEIMGYYAKLGSCVDRGPSVARRMLNNISTVTSIAAFGSFDVYKTWTRCFGKRDELLTVANDVDGRVRDLILNKWHPLHTAQYVWTKGLLENVFLSCLGDRMEMAHSLEARMPLLDHYLTEYVNNLPPSVKIRYGEDGRPIEKWILREASKPFVTTELYERKKHPYEAPRTYTHNGPVHKAIARLLTESNVERLGFVDWNRTKELEERAFSRHDPTAMRLAITVCQWVVIGQRFGVQRAEISDYI